jgi:hypothetical protein
MAGRGNPPAFISPRLADMRRCNRMARKAQESDGDARVSIGAGDGPLHDMGTLAEVGAS